MGCNAVGVGAAIGVIALYPGSLSVETTPTKHLGTRLLILGWVLLSTCCCYSVALLFLAGDVHLMATYILSSTHKAQEHTLGGSSLKGP